MAYVVAAPEQPSLPVRGKADRFPVRRIFCVGRNYAAHAKEMGAAGDKPAGGPMYFTKSAHALAQSGSTLPFPPGTSNYHYEVELVLALGGIGGAPVFRVTPEQAVAAIYGYAVGFDMTRRDLQNAAKDKGHPWDLGKDCEGGAVVSEIVPFAELGLLDKGDIRLTRNGELKQQGDLVDMIWRRPLGGRRVLPTPPRLEGGSHRRQRLRQILLPRPAARAAPRRQRRSGNAAELGHRPRSPGHTSPARCRPGFRPRR